MERLARHPWPGNVRELENAVERALVVGKEPLLRAADFALGEPDPELSDFSLEAMERRHIQRTLEQFNWNQTHAAHALGIDRVTLYHKIKRYGLRSAANGKRAAG
jgi:DNA-binding NtrC family response regulator